MNRYVMTPEDLAIFESSTQWPTVCPYQMEGISLEFTTTEEFVQSVLPPCFDPVDEPRGVAAVGSYRRDDGAGRLEMDSASIFLEASYQGRVGLYTLTMLVSGDMPVTLGRERFGEVKKRGKSRMYFDGKSMYAYGERHKVRIMEIEAELGPDTGASSSNDLGLELKAAVDTGFARLHHNPTVVVTRLSSENAVTRTGSGSLTFNDNGRDPVASIPVVSTGTATYVAGHSVLSVDSAHELEVSHESYIPYVLGRQYDFPRARP